jgi:hypothetical protein
MLIKPVAQRASQVAQPATLAQMEGLLVQAFRSVEQKLSLAARRLTSPYNVTVSIAQGPLSGAARYELIQNNRAIVQFDQTNLQRIWQAERQRPGLGQIVMEGLIINELFGVIYSARHPGIGTASRALELASNRASLLYLNRFYGKSPVYPNAAKVFQDINQQVRQGVAPYTNRAPGTPQQTKQAEAVIQRMLDRNAP